MLCERDALATLTQWRDLFGALERVPLDPDGEPSLLLSMLEERQRLIDGIQRLDGDVKSLAEIGRENWPGFSSEGAETARNLLAAARASCDATRANDALVSEILKQNRSVVLSQLHGAKHCKKYLPPHRDSVKHDPIIVDDHA
jgi:hypothetical protein